MAACAVTALLLLCLAGVSHGLTCWRCVSDLHPGCQWDSQDLSGAEHTTSHDCNFCLTQRFSINMDPATVYRSCSKRCPRSHTVTRLGDTYTAVTRCCNTDLCNTAQDGTDS